MSVCPQCCVMSGAYCGAPGWVRQYFTVSDHWAGSPSGVALSVEWCVAGRLRARARARAESACLIVALCARGDRHLVVVSHDSHSPQCATMRVKFTLQFSICAVGGCKALSGTGGATRLTLWLQACAKPCCNQGNVAVTRGGGRISWQGHVSCQQGWGRPGGAPPQAVWGSQ